MYLHAGHGVSLKQHVLLPSWYRSNLARLSCVQVNGHKQCLLNTRGKKLTNPDPMWIVQSLYKDKVKGGRG